MTSATCSPTVMPSIGWVPCSWYRPAVTGGFTKLCRTNVPSATIGQLLFFFDFFFFASWLLRLAFGSGWAGAEGAPLARPFPP